MSLSLMVLHALNFTAPALGVALILGTLEVLVTGHKPWTRHFSRAAAVYFASGVAVLLLGLLIMGRDGKMLTYAVLVLVTGTVAAWRRHL